MRLVARHRQHGDGRIGVRIAVRLHQLPEVHPVQLIAGQDEHIGAPVLDHVADLLADGVGGALIPLGRLVGLLRRQDFDEAAIERIELVRVRNVPVQTDGEELRQDVDAVQSAIDAITDGDIDEPVFAGHGNGRLTAELGQRVQPGAPTAAEDQRENVLHEWPFSRSSR